MLAVNIVNIDGLIATKYRPSVNGEIDYFYLTSLSPDGVESWVNATTDAQSTIARLEPLSLISPENYRQFYWAKSTIYRLDNNVRYLNDKYGGNTDKKNINEQARKNLLKIRKWQSFNLGEFNAFQKILENKNIFDQLPVLIQKIDQIENKVTDEIRQNVPLDRATEPPLI